MQIPLILSVHSVWKRRMPDGTSADFVWFCKDIEQVYTGNSVDKGRKKNEAVSFKVKKKIGELRAEKLTHVEYRNGVSNIMTVLDQYLERK